MRGNGIQQNEAQLERTRKRPTHKRCAGESQNHMWVSVRGLEQSSQRAWVNRWRFELVLGQVSDELARGCNNPRWSARELIEGRKLRKLTTILAKPIENRCGAKLAAIFSEFI